jgi:hypothetical protein
MFEEKNNRSDYEGKNNILCYCCWINVFHQYKKMKNKNYLQFRLAFVFCGIILLFLLPSCNITETDNNNSNNQVKYKGKLAIAKENNILIKDLDGNVIRNTYINTIYELGPIYWSNNGDKIFANFKKKNKPWYNLSLIDISSNTFTELVDTNNIPLRGYAQDYHPKENKLLYLVDSVYTLREFIEYDINSKMQKKIINLGVTFDIFSMRWHPNGEQIVFSSLPSNQQFPFQLYLMNSNGTQIREIFFSNYHTFYKPFWSPNGQYIALHLEYAEPPKYKEIVFYDINNNEWRTLLSTINEGELNPREVLGWDLQSKLILFTAKDFSRSPAQINLYTISIKTKEIKLVYNEFVKLQDYHLALYLEE